MRSRALPLALVGLLALTACGEEATPASSPSTPASSASSQAVTDAEVDEATRKGFDTATKSDLRNLATQEETLLTDSNSYGSFADLDKVLGAGAVQVSDGVTLTIVAFDIANAYCFSGKHELSPTTWFYDSQAGGLLSEGATSCPQTTTGKPGGSRSGAPVPADALERARAETRRELEQIREANEAARAEGPITEAERAAARTEVVGEILQELRDSLLAAQEIYLTSNASYATLDQLDAAGEEISPPPGVTLTLTALKGADGFCAELKHELSPEPVLLDSAQGGTSDGCTVKGSPGGERRGAALSTAERAAIEEQVEEYVLGARVAKRFSEESPEESDVPEEPADPIAEGLRNLATAEETYLTDTNTYGTIAQLRAAKAVFSVPAGVTLSVVRYDGANAYCLSASDGKITRWYDSAAGGLLPESATGCTATKTGEPGDSVTG